MTLFTIIVYTRNIASLAKLNNVDNLINEDMTLPTNIREWLNNRGINDAIIEANGLDWNGKQIVIPIKNVAGRVIFNKYRRDPFGPDDVPKYTYETGTTAQLFNSHKLAGNNVVLICEGEFDAMVAESLGICAITSTGGCGTFKEEWLDLLIGKEVFICFDNDEAGIKGAVRLMTKIQGARMMMIPSSKDVKDITDYVMQSGIPYTCLQILMMEAESFPALSEHVPELKTIASIKEQKKKYGAFVNELVEKERKAIRECEPSRHYRAIIDLMMTAFHNLNRKEKNIRFMKKKVDTDGNEDGRITNADVERAKMMPIEELYVGRLKKEGNRLSGLCPFHNERSASFVIYTDHNTFHCFGCSAGRDPIDFVMKRDGITFIDAIKKLLKK